MRDAIQMAVVASIMVVIAVADVVAWRGAWTRKGERSSIARERLAPLGITWYRSLRRVPARTRRSEGSHTTMDAVLPDPATPFEARVAQRLRATSPEEQLCYMHGGGCSLHPGATGARYTPG
jgi:hypothetical protein